MLSSDKKVYLASLDHSTLLAGRSETCFVVALALASGMPYQAMETHLEFSKYWTRVSEQLSVTLDKVSMNIVVDKAYVKELVRKIMIVRSVKAHEPYWYFFNSYPAINKALLNKWPEDTIEIAENAICATLPDLKTLMGMNQSMVAVADIMKSRIMESSNRLNKQQLRDVVGAAVDILKICDETAREIIDMSFSKDSVIGVYAFVMSDTLGLSQEESEKLFKKHFKNLKRGEQC